MLIGVSGIKGSGKSTISKFLVSKGFETVSFAGPLKDLVSDAFGLPMFLLTDTEAKERHALSVYIQPLHIQRMVSLANSKYARVTEGQLAQAIANIPKDLIKTPRQLLQVVGTDIFRNNVSLTYWLECFKTGIKANKNYVCDDVRFANEQQLIKDLGGYLIGINRPSLIKSDIHASEQIDLSNCDFVLQNIHTLAILKKDVETTFELIKELEWQKVGKEVKSKVFGA
jgi:hypothetical protein